MQKGPQNNKQWKKKSLIQNVLQRRFLKDNSRSHQLRYAHGLQVNSPSIYNETQNKSIYLSALNPNEIRPKIPSDFTIQPWKFEICFLNDLNGNKNYEEIKYFERISNFNSEHTNNKLMGLFINGKRMRMERYTFLFSWNRFPTCIYTVSVAIRRNTWNYSYGYLDFDFRPTKKRLWFESQELQFLAELCLVQDTCRNMPKCIASTPCSGFPSSLNP